MNKPTTPDFFTKEASVIYDERNRQLAPIADNMHFLIRLILRDLPVQSRVLCIGVGTGAEILSLAKAFPQWTFVGVDPSASMLEVCHQRLVMAGLQDRCELIHGYVQDVPSGESFNAVLSVLVGHFVSREERLNFYKEMVDRLHPKGHLINTEISFDLNSQEFPLMLKNWEGVQSMMGATSESLATLPFQLREMLSIISPAETESLLNQSGIDLPVRFFQAFMICGWQGQKI
jgi:tRNA (cmo5U34)-methyltransferase